MNQNQIFGNCEFFEDDQCPHKEEEAMISLIREINNMGDATVSFNPTTSKDDTQIYDVTREIVNRKFCNNCKVFQER
jgi:hypothetical protein